MPPVKGFLLVGRGILLLLAMIPILIAGKFSKVTNDTVSLRLRTLPVIGVFILVLVAVLTLGALAMLAPDRLAYLSVVALGGVAWGTWAMYGWYYERGQVDLLRVKQ
jgi:hypothetical protein